MTDEIVALKRVLREMDRNDLELYAAVNAVVLMRLLHAVEAHKVYTDDIEGFSQEENDKMFNLSEIVSIAVRTHTDTNN